MAVLGAILCCAVLAGEAIPTKKIEALADQWWKARPATRFEDWDAKVKAALLEQARAVGAIPEGSLAKVQELLWKSAHKHLYVKQFEKIATPYGEAKWIEKGRGGAKFGLIIGLHGGGEGVGSASDALDFGAKDCLGLYPQGIHLVHDTWNTVHGERFVLTLIEIAKLQREVDPDRVYTMGFSMGGSGSWFMAGRHPDLFAGASPCAGVLMAAPKSQLEHQEEVQSVQHGLVPNVRNLAMYYYIGLADRNCMPGTYLYVWDMLQRLRDRDPGGYQKIEFKTYEGLPHAFPPGEPAAGIKWLCEQRREALPKKIVWEYALAPYPQPDATDRSTRFLKQWFYWLHCEHPVDQMKVVATRAGNEFDLDIQVARAADFTLLLNPSLIDVKQDVIVRVGGKEVYRGKPVPDVATVLESLDARLDRTLTFDRRIALTASP